MITQSGIHVQKVGGEMGTPTAEDIAVQSGRVCRYGGAIWVPNLTHLVFVGLMAYKRSGNVANLIWGFLHDAHEICTGEVPRPFKCECMRTEQNAIDQRLLRHYFGEDGWLNIDFDIIKQCDIDVCHIEATMLELPGFAKTELKYGKDYTQATKIHDNFEDQSLFFKLRGGPFYNDTLNGMESYGVRIFAETLQRAERGEYDEMLGFIGSWGFGSLTAKTGYFTK